MGEDKVLDFWGRTVNVGHNGGIHVAAICVSDPDLAKQRMDDYGLNTTENAACTRPADHGVKKGLATFRGFFSYLPDAFPKTHLGPVQTQNRELIYQDADMLTATAYMTRWLFIMLTPLPRRLRRRQNRWLM